VARHGAVPDVPYVRRWLGELARVAEDPEVLVRFERIGRSQVPGGERADRVEERQGRK
jgi:hypothetical protein